MLGVDQPLHDPPWPQCMKGVGFQRQGTPFTDMFHPCHQPLGRHKRGLSVAQLTEGDDRGSCTKELSICAPPSDTNMMTSSGFGIPRTSCDGDVFRREDSVNRVDMIFWISWTQRHARLGIPVSEKSGLQTGGQKCIKTIEGTKLQTYYGYM